MAAVLHIIRREIPSSWSPMQRTICQEVEISGVGLHSGRLVTATLCPAKEHSGITFRRTDLQGFEIPAHMEHVSRVVLATTLMKRGVMLSTVEHLLSALYGLGIDNLIVNIDSLEVPIVDGSALPFARLIHKAGICQQSEVEQLRKSNLIRGGSLENAVVLSQTDILNGDLRSQDEFVRHKILDLIGDIALCSYPIMGHIHAFKAGHALHTRLARQLSPNNTSCEITCKSLTSQTMPG